MQPLHVLLLILGYFGLLVLISYLTSKASTSNDAFFKASKQSPWYLVAFGMIGATLSGVTFISVPGTVAEAEFSYMQMVFGFFLGTLVIVYILLPLYYKANVTSIYQYLDKRLGTEAHKTGAAFFLLSRTIGAAFRLYLVALTFQYLIFEKWGVPFAVTVVISIALIWIYTHRAGIKTIVWTDTLQTFFMLAAVFMAIVFITNELNWSFSEFLASSELKEFNKIFFFDDFKSKSYFWKSLFGGAFMAIAMTGLDQDMMQKNLTCRNLKDAQKNMMTMISLLVVVNFIFLSLGALLFIYANKNGIEIPMIDGKTRTDLLFPEIAVNSGLGLGLAIVFILGLIAAAYSSADSALTSLTTSVCVDFLDIENKEAALQEKTRKKTHILVSIALIFIIILFNEVLDQSVISGLFTIASYTYGPLMGLFFFSIFTKEKVKGNLVPIIAVLAVAISYALNYYVPIYTGYKFGFELLGVNGLLTFLGLWLIRKK
jgi:SSS family transporter